MGLNVGFFHSTKDWCADFVDRFRKGAARHGDEVHPVGLDTLFSAHPEWDAACILGIGYLDTWNRVSRAPVPMVFLDKGYTRTGDYFYASIGAYRPISYIGHWGKPDDRRKKFGWEPKHWRKPTSDGHILIAGSSLKFHHFHGLPHPEVWCTDLVAQIQRHSKRVVRYRPKPNQPLDDRVFLPDGSWIKGERKTLEEDLRNCHVCITHGSSVALDALLAGIPGMVLGTAITKPISSDLIDNVEHPELALLESRLRLLNDLGYCQWSLAEYESGEAWATIRPELMKLI